MSVLINSVFANVSAVNGTTGVPKGVTVRFDCEGFQIQGGETVKTLPPLRIPEHNTQGTSKVEFDAERFRALQKADPAAANRMITEFQQEISKAGDSPEEYAQQLRTALVDWCVETQDMHREDGDHYVLDERGVTVNFVPLPATEEGQERVDVIMSAVSKFGA